MRADDHLPLSLLGSLGDRVADVIHKPEEALMIDEDTVSGDPFVADPTGGGVAVGVGEDGGAREGRGVAPRIHKVAVDVEDQDGHVAAAEDVDEVVLVDGDGAALAHPVAGEQARQDEACVRAARERGEAEQTGHRRQRRQPSGGGPHPCGILKWRDWGS